MKSESGQTNALLKKARAAKNDEFYTRRESIENELHYYRPHFVGKTVYCNCDDPKISEFYLYFKRCFAFLKLKRLITTCYKNQDADMFSKHDKESAVSVEYDGVAETTRFLRSDGDFRSPESIALLQRADIVCTNPPFSLFREYVSQLIAEKKQFLIIGNSNALHYRDIFPLIMADKLWVGFAHRTMEFGTPHGAVVRMRNVLWYTNMDHAARHEELILTERYRGNESAYPKYDNYDAINVDRVVKIPRDYAGVMGVPDNFLYSRNPAQFELLGNLGSGKIDGKAKYSRMLIRNRNPE